MQTDYEILTTLVPAARYEKPGLIDEFTRFIKEGDLVLDAGCGRGIDGSQLQTRTGCTVIGLDEAPSVLLVAEKMGLRVILADLNRRWPAEDDTFDAVMGIFAVHNLQNREHFFSEASRVLRVNGRLLILTASHADIRRRWLNRFFPSLPALDLDRYPSNSDFSQLFNQHSLVQDIATSVRIRTECLDEEYVEHVVERHWSSLQQISDEDFISGSQRFQEFALDHLSTGTRISWENTKTLLVSTKLPHA